MFDYDLDVDPPDTKQQNGAFCFFERFVVSKRNVIIIVAPAKPTAVPNTDYLVSNGSLNQF